jgi:predicted nucleotidyltransferase component of viral defense system
LIHSDLLPPYTLVHLDEKKLVGEKVQSCLTRGKARDFYDLYFILRSRMAFKETFAKDKTLKAKLLAAIDRQKLDIRSELKRFLPVNQHLILKNLKPILIAEIERNLP